MGADIVTRQRFSAAVSSAFSAANIQSTASALAPIAASGDHLDYFDRLGILTYIPSGGLTRYRASLGIPAVNQQIITLVLRHAITSVPPIPVAFDVQSGATEMVTVSVSASGLSVVVIRTGYGPIS